MTQIQSAVYNITSNNLLTIKRFGTHIATSFMILNKTMMLNEIRVRNYMKFLL